MTDWRFRLFHFPACYGVTRHVQKSTIDCEQICERVPGVTESWEILKRMVCRSCSLVLSWLCHLKRHPWRCRAGKSVKLKAKVICSKNNSPNYVFGKNNLRVLACFRAAKRFLDRNTRCHKDFDPLENNSENGLMSSRFDDIGDRVCDDGC